MSGGGGSRPRRSGTRDVVGFRLPVGWGMPWPQDANLRPRLHPSAWAHVSRR